MGKKGGGGNNEAAQARADEQERQSRIRAGTARINEIFEGRTVGSGALDKNAVYDPKAVYYKADGSRWTPDVSAFTSPRMMGGGTPGPTVGSGSSFMHQDMNRNPQPVTENQSTSFFPKETKDPTDDPNAAAERAFREALGGGLYTGTTKTSGFNNDFFANRRKAFLDYATPQLEDQYGDANEQLTYALARSGLLDSSVRADKGAELQKKYDLNKQQIGDQALAYENEARTNVEKARSDLITMLNATGDAEGAANSALARSQALSAPQAFSPLTQLFSDFTSGLATQAAWERGEAMGGPKGRYNTGLFANNKAVQVKN